MARRAVATMASANNGASTFIAAICTAMWAEKGPNALDGRMIKAPHSNAASAVKAGSDEMRGEVSGIRT